MPSGATSQRRTTTSALGRSTASSSVASGSPRSSSGSVERIGVERERDGVVGPLVAREVGRLPLRRPGAGLGAARLDAEQLPRLASGSSQTREPMRGDGQAGSATQRPGRTS